MSGSNSSSASDGSSIVVTATKAKVKVETCPGGALKTRHATAGTRYTVRHTEFPQSGPGHCYSRIHCPNNQKPQPSPLPAGNG